ncbi:MAG: hypothetical protein AAFR38_12840 [Planctomycetota bacterium]
MTGEALLFWGVVLVLLSLLLIVAEAFIPSGGVIAAISFVLAVAGIYMLFRHDVGWGVTGLLTVLVLGPIAFFWSVNALPYTPFGRKLIGAESDDAAAERELDEIQAERERLALIGRRGEALSDLRPIGLVRLDAAEGADPVESEALAEDGWIEAGDRIEVIGIDLHELRVRRA